MTDPALLAAMYDTDPEEPINTSFEPDSRTRKIRVGIIEYEVPTVEYVNRLEQVVARQQATLERQQRMIARLQVMVTGLRRAVRGQGNAINEVYDELDTKLGIQG
jgi:hypothetical protein